MFNDLISIIVPAYNVENFVEACVLSLINQSYSNTEIIIVDDCSTDNTYALCLQLKKKYSNIIIEKNLVNSGQEKTREKGISLATGKWIMFLDADDTYALDGIEKCTKKLKDDIDILFSPYIKVENDKQILISTSVESSVFSISDFCKNLFSNIRFEFMSCIGSKIYRKQFLIENNIHFDDKYKFNEDGGFVFDALKSANKIYLDDTAFYLYNIRQSGSIQSSYRPNMLPTINNVYITIKELLISNSSFNEEVSKGFYRQRGFVFIASLENEAKFGKYNSFKKTFQIIRKDSDFKNVLIALKSENNKSVKVCYLCLKMNLKRILFTLFKIKKGK